jgi:carboxyl-terminal processing protease
MTILHRYKMKIYRMLKKYRWIWVLAPITLLFLGFCSNKIKKSEDLLPKIILQTLANAHYRPIDIDDSFSTKVFDLFLKRLDRNKRFFYDSDFENFKEFQYDLDEQSKNGTYQFFDLVSETYKKRVVEIESIYEEVLSSPIDFNVVEYYDFDEDSRVFMSSVEEMREDWRKYLKFNVLEKLYGKLATAEKEGSVSPATYDSLLNQSIEDVLKIQRSWFKRLQKFDREKQLDMYINCIPEVFDPHTSYFPPREKEDFDIRMSGRLEGIGAQLSERDGEIKVEMIVPGSPSYLQGELKEGDIVLKVAQKDSVPVSVVNMDLSDAVILIRGKKGTTVTLTVRKPDGTIKDISIVRDVVIMEEGYAKSAVINEGKSKIGFIHLPQFYTDMNSRVGRTCSKDVKDEVLKLMDEGVHGIVLDLRNNGGGSLQDVVDMAGLFVGKRPIVQARYKDRKPDILISREKKIVYDGPLVILVNKYSASASEILAAALQDYNRALILGANDQTFGKGTVQRFLDLNRFSPNPEYTFGSLKVTIQKFYRVNGGTTQLTGVVPDLILPERFSSIPAGERTEDYPLQWNEIDSLPLKMDMPSQQKAIAQAVKKAQKRVGKSQVFKLIEEESKRVELNRNKTRYPLNYEEFKAEQLASKAEFDSFDAAFKANVKELQLVGLSKDLEAIGSDTAKLKMKQDWLKNYQKDIYLNEAVSVIIDLK